jgi:hypothetical protein
MAGVLRATHARDAGEDTSLAYCSVGRSANEPLGVEEGVAMYHTVPPDETVIDAGLGTPGGKPERRLAQHRRIVGS